MLAETTLAPSDFIYPLFVTGGRRVRRPIGPMPGCFQLSVDEAVKESREAASLGIPAVLLFGLPGRKDDLGSGAADPGEAVQRAAGEIKRAVPSLTVITDVCLCEYTGHGHCGVLRRDGTVDNDATLPLLAAAAVSHARAGAGVVAPSAMMDGQVAAIRSALDSEGFGNVAVMGYSAKYASAFFGPFRVAAESAPRSGDRRAYQMDPPNAREAMREIEADLAEGADLVMVKPALAYLDVIAAARRRFDAPIVAYNVSGEYAMVKAAAANGWLDERRAAMEVLTGIKRAGADLIISYHAKDAARWLAEG
jgi:porphobilinogen synthase